MRRYIYLFFVCLIGSSLLLASRGLTSADLNATTRITHLPGWSPKPLPSNQYSGFVDANHDGSLQMHFWFVESENDPEHDPLVLWFNGGPGASSLYGMLVELGPFLLSDLSYSGIIYEQTGMPQLIYNNNGWQKFANVLALSMPPPVGFSYCTPPGPSASGSDCGEWNDTSTADVTYFALNSWLKEFPQFKSNNMFVTGESYAGVYVPMLVQRILDNPSDGINLHGFAVGDACTPPDICGSKVSGPYWSLQFLFGKGAFSNKLFEEINKVCTQDELINGGLSDECADSVNKVNTEVAGYWVYGFYDNCWYENDIRRHRKLIDVAVHQARVNSAEEVVSGMTREDGNADWQYHGPPIVPTSSLSLLADGDIIRGRSSFIGGNGYACGGPSAQVDWLSRPEVLEALNVPLDATFFQCDNGNDFVYTLTEGDIVSFYKQVIAENKLRVLVYNGDTDPGINAYQAQEWTRNLGFEEKESWRGWTLDGCQSMGGYVTRYENNFDFLTIRGSGHMVPLGRPQATLNFMSRFVRGEDYLTYDAACTGTGSTTTTTSVQPWEAEAEELAYSDEDISAVIAEIQELKAQHEKATSTLEKKLQDLIASTQKP